MTTIAIFLPLINSFGWTHPPYTVISSHQGMAVPSDYARNFGRRERRKTIEAYARGAALRLGAAVQNANACSL
jgi:hypothetical protein